MKILITSDIHGKIEKLKKVILKEKPSLIIDAGDSELTDYDLNINNIISVRGNCDYINNQESNKILNLPFGKTYLTHGNLYNIKNGYSLLIKKLINLNINYCICGHTHIQKIFKINNITIINPGSLGYNNTYIIYENNKFIERVLI